MAKKRRKKQPVQFLDFDIAGEAALTLVQQAIEAKRKKGEEYPPEWEDPDFIRNNIAPALLNKLLAMLPLVPEN
jgi:hypothetical protein